MSPSSPATSPAPSPSPTLLVFTLGEQRESRRRRLLPAAHGRLERRLHRACLDSALAAGREAGCQLVVSSPSPFEVSGDVRRHRQRGRGFGRRLGAAFAAAMPPGGGPVVLVGTDVPGLRSDHVRGAVEALGEDPERVVLGPSPDGGFYLLAAARPLDEALAAVRWCCRRTLRSLVRALRREGRRVVLLPALVDLDRRADLERWLASPGLASSGRGSRLAELWRPLIAWLAVVLAELRRTVSIDPASSLRPVPVRVPHLRGPPKRALPFS